MQQSADHPQRKLLALERQIRACRLCVEAPWGTPLPHEPRPVLQVSATARIAICGQAPGTRVHASGRPFTDPSGERLRTWLGVSPDTFYDRSRIAIVPMGFCFPGLDAHGGDLPPRRECAPRWRSDLFEHLVQLKLVVLVGLYAQRWHLGPRCHDTLTATVSAWRDFNGHEERLYFPLPHPSWRNNAWLKRNPWFEDDLLPDLRRAVRDQLAQPTNP